MKQIFLAFCLAAAPLSVPVTAVAQATNDDSPAIENWWDNVGAAFFSDAGLTIPRSEFEIRAQWTALSEEDQTAIRARCAGLASGQTVESTSEQDGITDDSTGTSAVGAAPGIAGTIPPGQTGFGQPTEGIDPADEATIVSVCGLVPEL